jgi:hypothetical protein
MNRDGGEFVLGPEARLRFVTLLAELSSRFIKGEPGDVDREIEDAPRRVCERLAIDDTRRAKEAELRQG